MSRDTTFQPWRKGGRPSVWLPEDHDSSAERGRRRSRLIGRPCPEPEPSDETVRARVADLCKRLGLRRRRGPAREGITLAQMNSLSGEFFDGMMKTARVGQLHPFLAMLDKPKPGKALIVRFE